MIFGAGVNFISVDVKSDGVGVNITCGTGVDILKGFGVTVIKLFPIIGVT